VAFLLGVEKGEDMQKTKIEERRIFERIPAKLSLRFLDTHSNKYGLVQTRDISAQGVGLLTENELPAHIPLDIWLSIPNKRESYYTRGEVVWSREVEPNKYRAGVRLEKVDFMGISQALRTTI
jgi:hypothetical protein